jgi:CMP-N,N'-diacetyllegionaminic acid synthase|tara:strand:+ start:308 stop:994 length:687 start_codon:yes stop_codon:yes gene_type:complete
MKNLGKIVFHIPAREGSKRVPKKNLRNMNGKPMISYAIEALLQADITENCYVNTDSDGIIKYVKTNYPEMRIYLRDKELCNDNTQSDHFNADIINKLQPDTLIMINPVCPLIESEDIVNALNAYKNSDCDTMISSCSTHMQTFCDGEPVNIDIKEALAPSQINPLITTLNWAITIWDAKLFADRMDKDGYAVWGKQISFYDIDEIKSIKVSEEKDFLTAEKLLKIKSI